jgi:uncharacterized protein YecT (DUF1311 family)
MFRCQRVVIAKLPAPIFACIIAAAVTAVATHPGLAEPADPPVDCNNASSTYEINYCSDAELEEADKELNATFQKALSSVASRASEEEQYDAKRWEQALRASQRAWIAFRDVECDGHIPMFWTGGTGTTAAVLGCKTTKAKARTEELRTLYEDG